MTAPLPLAVQLDTFRDPDADGAAAFTERPASLSPGVPAQLAPVAP